uniref:Uncharacterized protein n=1 Tax=Arundo donax TaxID=35708 RepID=A0A0A9B1Z9_ARUDO
MHVHSPHTYHLTHLTKHYLMLSCFTSAHLCTFLCTQQKLSLGIRNTASYRFKLYFFFFLPIREFSLFIISWMSHLNHNGCNL